jgi:hypothetical protein
VSVDQPGRARIPELSNIPWEGPRAINDDAGRSSAVRFCNPKS